MDLEFNLERLISWLPYFVDGNFHKQTELQDAMGINTRSVVSADTHYIPPYRTENSFLCIRSLSWSTGSLPASVFLASVWDTLIAFLFGIPWTESQFIRPHLFQTAIFKVLQLNDDDMLIETRAVTIEMIED